MIDGAGSRLQPRQTKLAALALVLRSIFFVAAKCIWSESSITASQHPLMSRGRPATRISIVQALLAPHVSTATDLRCSDQDDEFNIDVKDGRRRWLIEADATNSEDCKMGMQVE
jgi:hypothetical protein